MESGARSMNKIVHHHALLLWDFENVAPPKDVSLQQCIERIRAATGVHNGDCRVFCNVKTGISDQRRQECQKAGLVLVDVPSRKPNASDMQIQVAMTKHALALGKDSRGVVVLISGDSDFAEIGVTMREHKIEFVLVHNTQANAVLRSAASRTFDFVQIIKTVSCSLCSKSFKTKLALEQHSKSKHTKVLNVVKEVAAEFSCLHCGRMFQTEKLLVEHVNSLDLLAILGTSLKDSRFKEECDLKEAANVLVMKRNLGVLRENPNDLLREVRLQLVLDTFCTFQIDMPTNWVSLAAWLIVDPEDINFSGPSAHYQPERRRDEYSEITPLIASCRNDNIVAVRYILKSFPNVNINATRSADGSAALHIACYRGAHEIVYSLLQHPGVNVNMLEEKKPPFWNGLQIIPSLPLHIAIQHGHVEVVRTLIRHSFDAFLESPEGFSLVAIAIEYAFRNLGSENFMAYSDILDSVLQVVAIESWRTKIPRSNPSIFMIPKCFCELEPLTMERWLDQKNDVKKEFTGTSCSIIFYVLNKCSAIHGFVDVYESERVDAAKALTKKILKLTKVSFSPKIEGHPWERSILFAAAETNDVEIVKSCLNFSETSRADSVGCSPLLVAAVHSNVEIVRLLLQNGAFLEVSNVRAFLAHCKHRSVMAWVKVAMECFRRACAIENVTLGALWTKKTVSVLEEAMDSNSCVCF